MIKVLFDWFINLLLMFFLFSKRNKNIWLFGSWNGETYNDNSKYLFEYVVENFPSIEAVWITKNPQIKKNLLAENKQCYLSNEFIARKLRMSAGIVFFTNGISDIGNYDLSHGSKKIALWHGMPLKKLHYATNSIKNRKNIIRFLQYFFLKLYHGSDRDITIATSERTKEFLIESFDVQPESVFITGQPRNDVLFDQNLSNKLKIKLHHKPDERFILYIPTWRDFGKNESFLNNIIQSLYIDEGFMNEINERKIKLYIKPHPRIHINTSSKENVIIIDSKSSIDTQELLASADSIITDYSSAFIDYSLLDRPIHFFIPDLNNYKKTQNDIFLNFDEFSEYNFRDLVSFKKCIINNENIYSIYGLRNSEKINSIFNAPYLIKGKYCKTLIDILKDNKILTT